MSRRLALGGIGALFGAWMWLSGAVGHEVTPTGRTDSSCPQQAARSPIEKLLELLDVFAAARAQANAVVERLKRDNPKVAVEFWPSFTGKLIDHDTLVCLYAPIFQHHLPQDDIRALVSFYSTPLGRHDLKAAPHIQASVQEAARSWTLSMVAELLRAAPGSGVPLDPQSPQPASHDHPSDARAAAIHELLRRSGDLATEQQMIAIALDQLRTLTEQITLPSDFWAGVRKRLLDEDALLDLSTPAYAKEFTAADIRGLLAFYQSDVGARYASALPAINAERLEAGRQLGRDAAKRAVRQTYGPLPQWRLLHPNGTGTRAPEPRALASGP